MGYYYVLVIVCMIFGWVEAFSCHKADALIVAKKLLENMFPTWDKTSMVSSDQGTHFSGQIIWALVKTLQTSWNYHSPYHPQSSGKVERTNGILKLKISKLAETYWTPLA